MHQARTTCPYCSGSCGVLACGTQCGSCLPELKSLIEERAQEEGRHASARTTPDTVDVT